MLVSKLVKFFMSILKQQVNSCSNFESFYSVIKHNSSEPFSSNSIYFLQKDPIKVQLFWTFECSDQNLSNSSCQFWKDKSIPLQIFFYSSLPWHTNPPWMLSSYIFYFRYKDSIRAPILRLLNTLVKICQISHVISS